MHTVGSVGTGGLGGKNITITAVQNSQVYTD